MNHRGNPLPTQPGALAVVSNPEQTDPFARVLGALALADPADAAVRQPGAGAQLARRAGPRLAIRTRQLAASACGWSARRAAGSRISTQAPPSGRLAAEMLPPISSGRARSVPRAAEACRQATAGALLLLDPGPPAPAAAPNGNGLLTNTEMPSAFSVCSDRSGSPSPETPREASRRDRADCNRADCSRAGRPAAGSGGPARSRSPRHAPSPPTGWRGPGRRPSLRTGCVRRAFNALPAAPDHLCSCPRWTDSLGRSVRTWSPGRKTSQIREIRGFPAVPNWMCFPRGR
jgi:hypothetical protein